MKYITADESMRDHLHGILEPVEVRDENGKVLGVFQPCVTPELLAAYEKAKRLIDLDKVRAVTADDDKGSSLEDVWKRIKARGPQQ